MRSFVVVGHKAVTSPNFSLEDIPGTSGRMDILCRCINAAFMLSHGIRKDVNVYLVLLGGEPTKVLWLKGDELIRNINSSTSDNVAFILGDHTGMMPEEECLINRAGAEIISVGPTSLHADHCIVLINWVLDVLRE